MHANELLQFMGLAPGQKIQVNKLANGVLALQADKLLKAQQRKARLLAS